MITPAQRAEIRRLYYGEHWKIGTIAAQLGLHHETVRAAVERDTGGFRRGACRPSILGPASAVHPRHPGAVPAPARDTDLRDAPASGATPARSSNCAVSCSACGPRPATPSTAGSSPCPASPRRSTGARSARSASDRAPRTVSGIRHGPRLLARAGRAVHPRPDARELPPGTRPRLRRARRHRPQPRLRQPPQRGPRPPRRPPCSFIPACSSWPAITTSPPGPAPRDGGTKSFRLHTTHLLVHATQALGCCRRSRNRFPGWATGSGPVGGSKSNVPLSSARTARSTPWRAKRLAVVGCTSSSSAICGAVSQPAAAKCSA